MLDSVHLLASHPSSSVGALFAAPFSFPLLLDLLGAMRNSTSRFERIHSGALDLCKKSAKKCRSKRWSGGKKRKIHE